MLCQEELRDSEWVKMTYVQQKHPVTLFISSVVSGWVFWSTSWMVCFWFWVVPIVWGGLSSNWHVNPWFTLVIIILSAGKADGPRLEFALSHPFSVVVVHGHCLLTLPLEYRLLTLPFEYCLLTLPLEYRLLTLPLEYCLLTAPWTPSSVLTLPHGHRLLFWLCPMDIVFCSDSAPRTSSSVLTLPCGYCRLTAPRTSESAPFPRINETIKWLILLPTLPENHLYTTSAPALSSDNNLARSVYCQDFYLLSGLPPTIRTSTFRQSGLLPTVRTPAFCKDFYLL